MTTTILDCITVGRLRLGKQTACNPLDLPSIVCTGTAFRLHDGGKAADGGTACWKLQMWDRMMRTV